MLATETRTVVQIPYRYKVSRRYLTVGKFDVLINVEHCGGWLSGGYAMVFAIAIEAAIAHPRTTHPAKGVTACNHQFKLNPLQ